jgi:hypothetical protein
MDNPSMPWSLVGISDDARKAVRIAAAENDQTIGQWLNERILRMAAQESPKPDQAAANETGYSRAAHEVLNRMDSILADAEQYSTREIASYLVVLEQLEERLYGLEATDKTDETPVLPKR